MMTFYRGFEIEDMGYGDWVYGHPDSDGPEDDLPSGTCRSAEQCRAEIDEWCAERVYDAALALLRVLDYGRRIPAATEALREALDR